MSTGVLIVRLTHNYHSDLIKELINNGLPVRLVAISDRIEYQPDKLDSFLNNNKLNAFNYEPLYRPDTFEKIYKPNYQKLDNKLLEKISFYKDLFLVATDRNCFFPISAYERSRLFIKYLMHFFELINTNKIDNIIFFGIPHGPWSIALWGLAKGLNINIMYTSGVDIDTQLTTIETDLIVNRKYIKDLDVIGTLVNEKSPQIVRGILKNKMKKINFTKEYEERKMCIHKNIHKLYLKRVASLIFKKPLSTYISSEFDLNINRRMRISCAIPLLKHYLNVLKAKKFYKSKSTKNLPNKDSVVLFLHVQPEAALIPTGGFFYDQLLILDLILEALPNDMNVFVKEHPWQFESIGEDKHERSIDFYKYLIKDKRVKLLDRSIPSSEIIKKAGAIVSNSGNVSWESILIGRPSIVFGWSWFIDCKSCYVVDSVKTLRKAISKSRSISADEVFKDRDDFIKKLEKRLIYGAYDDYILPDLAKDYDYEEGIRSLGKALTMICENK
tara:strand:+ start:1847 stop:3346 length:1500 start_codon:yes stop_codon:yes gene_type:complete